MSVKSTALAVLGTGADIVLDPALPEFMRMVQEIRQLPGGRKSGSGPGIGLGGLIGPMRAYVTYRRNPWILPVALAAIIGIPFYLGRKSRR